MAKTMSEGELLLKFARDLKEIVDSFEEEVEILANKEILEEITKNEEEYMKGEYETFSSIEELREKLNL